MIKQYNANQLAAVSAVLARATAGRSWTHVGQSLSGATQEEVQAMRFKSVLVLACNSSGVDAIEALFKLYGLDADSFDKAIRCFYYVIAESTELGKTYKVDTKLAMSTQETNTLALAAIDDWHVRDYVEGLLAPKSGGTAKSTARAEALRNLAGETFTATQTPKGAVSTCKYSSFPIRSGVHLLKETTHKAHAEMKLLAGLVQLLKDGRITTSDAVHVGGLKAACQKCATVLTGFNAVCDNMLQLPLSDTRPSATPVNWALPGLPDLSTADIRNKANVNIAGTLATRWGQWASL